MNVSIQSVEAMKKFGEAIGKQLKGGEVLELVGDIGSGKTTLTKGIASGLGVTDDVQSPTFTISRVYDGRDGIELLHYDFYRLHEPGILRMELDEAAHRADAVTVIEWGEIIQDVLPADHLTVHIASPSEGARTVTLTSHGPNSQQLKERLV